MIIDRLLARNTLNHCFLEIFDISHFDQEEINSVQEFLLSSYSANKVQLPVQQNSTFCFSYHMKELGTI